MWPHVGKVTSFKVFPLTLMKRPKSKSICPWQVFSARQIIKLAWKGLLGTKTLAYFASALVKI
jgi:hypothetical protein